MNRPIAFVSQKLTFCLLAASVGVAHLAVAAPKATKQAAVPTTSAMSSTFAPSRFSGVNVRHVPQPKTTRSLQSRPVGEGIVLKNERRFADPRKGVTMDVESLIPLMGKSTKHKAAQKAGSHR